MPRQTTLSLDELIRIAKKKDGYSGPITGPGCFSASRLPRCASVNEIGVIWKEGDDPAEHATAEQALIDLLADPKDDVRFNAIGYLIDSPSLISPDHAHDAQAFIDDPANAEGIAFVRSILERNRAADQAATS